MSRPEFIVLPGRQFGSVDHQRSLTAGYRKHSAILRIVGRLRNARDIKAADYERALAAFYID